MPLWKRFKALFYGAPKPRAILPPRVAVTSGDYVQPKPLLGKARVEFLNALLDIVAASPGLTARAVHKRLGGDYGKYRLSQVTGALWRMTNHDKLLTAESVKGQRGHSYYPVPSEARGRAIMGDDGKPLPGIRLIG